MEYTAEIGKHSTDRLIKMGVIKNKLIKDWLINSYIICVHYN